MTADFRHIETWIFDLDNTLYPASCDLFALIDVRMGEFIQEMFDCDPVRAREIQKGYYHSHGTTLSGLMAEHGMEPKSFLDYVHDIDLGRLSADLALKAAIERLPGRRIVFTNGSKTHAERVTERLGIADLFHGWHDIEASGYLPKPRSEAYESARRRFDFAPHSAAMFEDIARNLTVPHEMGMTTVLVDGPKPWETDRPVPEPPSRDHIHHICEDLAAFLAGATVQTEKTAGAAHDEA